MGKTFEDLGVWIRSKSLAVEICRACRDCKDWGFRDQITRSAVSVPSNIAEGSARNKSQFVYYLKMAKSAIRECMVYTTISHNANLISDTYEDESRGVLMEMTKMTGALISSLQRSAGYNNSNGNAYHGNTSSDENRRA